MKLSVNGRRQKVDGKITKRVIYTLISFLLFVLSFFPFKIFPFAFFAFVPLFIALENLSWKRKILILIPYFYLFWVIHTFWILNMEVEPSVEKWLVLGLIILPLYLSFFNIIPLLFTENRLSLLLVPSLWIIFEHLRGTGDTGFPWVPVASSQLSNPLFRMLASIGGIYFLGWLIVFFNILFYRFLKTKDKKLLFFAFSLIFLLHLAGLYLYMKPSTCTDKLKIAVFQPNILPREEYDPAEWMETKEAYEYFYNTLNEKVDLIVFSESALPGYFRYSRREKELIKKLWEKFGAPIILGTTDVRFPKGRRMVFNAALLVEGDKIIDHYYKTHLVPFGEWLPFEDKVKFLEKVELGQGNYRPGKELIPFEVKGKKLGILICFESIFPRITRKFVKNGAELLVNITSDGWYGKSLGPIEHFELLRFRAIESGRYVVRCAKTGISAVIDNKGRVIKKIGLFKRGFFVEQVPFCEEITPYTKVGDLVVWLAYLIVLSILVYNKAKSGGKDE